MGFGDFQLNNNGKKEVLQNAQNGVRKEQVDKKFHNLFDAYDKNMDGTLETNELNEIFNGLSSFAGDDKVLDTAENQLVQSVFAEKMNLQNADFMGFVKSVSTASADIVSSKETPTADGGKEVVTTYNDGTTETIAYYPDGEYKFKKVDAKTVSTSYYYIVGNNLNKKYTARQVEDVIKDAYKHENHAITTRSGEKTTEIARLSYKDFKKVYMSRNNIKKLMATSESERHDLELSERAKQDVAVRDFVLSHYIETHQAAKEALESMGILDNAGALINAGAGEVWNAIKNKWNGTEEEYQNFYELKDKFSPNNKKLETLQQTQGFVQRNQDEYFKSYETSFQENFGQKYDLEISTKFQAKAEQYQNAQILKERLNLLKTAMDEVEQYQVDQGLLLHSPATSEGINPASHIVKANELLLQYFGGDQNAVDMILNGAMGDENAKVVQAIKDIYTETQKMNEAVLGGKSFDEIQDEYKTQYKEMYNTDFVPDDLTEKVMDAKATGSMVKLAAITIISVLITRSPIMAEINAGIAGGAEATGAAANLVKTLVAKYGQNAVAQGIKFAMTSGTLATDVGLTLLNQVTSERGVNGEELWESTKSSAKFIYFGAYVGGPLAQAVSKQFGKIGVTAKMFEGGVKTSNGAVQTTTIAGDKLMQNLMKGGNVVLTKGSAFLTDVAAFTALEVATDGQDVATAGKEQLEFLPKLKIMNSIIEYMLGGKVHAGMVKAKMDAAIEQSGVKNWEIKEIKSPTKSMYEVKIDKDMPPIRFENANDLATAMSEAVAGKYEKLNEANADTKQADNTPNPLPQGAREQSDMRTNEVNSRLENSKQKIQYLNDYQKFARVVLSSKSKGFWIPKLLNEKPGETISARLKIYNKLMKYKDRTVTEDALRVAELTNANNISVIETLVDDKQFIEYASDCGVRDELWGIVSSLDSVNMPLAEKLAKDNDFPSYLISKVLVKNRLPYGLRMSAKNYELPDYSKIKNVPYIKCYYKDIENLIKTIDLLKQNRDCTTDLFIEAVQALNGDNLALTDILFSIKDLPKNEIPRILRVTTKDTFDFAKRLCTDEKLNFPKDKIADIIRTTDEDILAFAERLCTDEKLNFPKDKIADILYRTTRNNILLTERLCTDEKLNFPKDKIADILYKVGFINKDNIDYAINLCTNYKKYGINQKHIAMLIKNKNNVSIEQYQQLLAQFNKEGLATWAENDIVIGCQLSGLIGSKNINEIPLSQKRSVLKQLVACNANLFGASEKLKELAPLIPRNQEEYCELLPSLVRSLGVETNKLSAEQITHTNKATQNLANSLAKLSDSDFAKLSISQEYSREDFINTVLEKTKDLSEAERQKVFDYYGFELLKNDTNKTGCTLYGYPVNLNNGHKLAEINDVKTKAVVESLRNDVVKFSKNNRIKCENPQVEQFLNEIVEVLPEIRTMIGKAQHGNNGTRGAHDYDVMKHSLKVMQKISQDPKFAKLSESDKKVMLLASLMHDITKAEGHPDGYHAENGAFDVFFISKKFNLTSEEETKLYKICKYHEWLNFVNTSKSEGELTKRLQSVAFDLQQDNLVDMAEIFTHADLRAVKADDSFHDTKVGKSRVDFNGNVRSFGESADVYVAKIKEYQKELQKSQPILPVTKFPQASRMKQAITTVNADGSTNLKGVYQDKDGVVVIKFNEMTDESWEAIGFPKGTSAKGVKAKGLNNSGAKTNVETGNIHFFVHGLDYSNQLAKFDAFSSVDSDALLSVSYAERPESKYRFFRTQGVLLDIPTKYVYGGGNTDSGSGCGKNIQEFKDRYIFGEERESDRLYISNLVKEATGMSDAEYVQFVKDNENKSMLEIEPANIREKIIQKFATINSNVRKGNREYNEMYGSNPRVMGVFAYSWEREVNQPIDFLNSVDNRTHFLKEYAKERDLPFVVFGD